MQLTESTIETNQSNSEKLKKYVFQIFGKRSKVKSDLQNSNWEGRSLGH